MAASRPLVTVARSLAAIALAALALTAVAPVALSRELLLTGAKPDRLFVIDAATRSIQSVFHIPDANGSVFTIVPSPNGRIAYVLVNKMERIVGIDLSSGKLVFRADLSGPGERVKNLGFTVTPDGKELIAYELPVLLKPNEYQVEEPRFAVFRTNAGLQAQPARSFAAPRRLLMLLMRPNGRSFYALGFDLYEYDVRSGKLLGQRGLQHWTLPAHSQPDILAFWPAIEPTGVFVTPLYSEVTTGDDKVLRTGLMSLNLSTGTLDFQDFEDSAALIFSTILSPDRKRAYGVYSTLTEVDVVHHSLARRKPLDHTYYSVNISADGHELYIGGAMCDVGFYDTATLERRANLKLPDCPDQSLASLRVIQTR
jgi:quinohemoprotein amine dehydrogenase beta subunit